VAGRLANKSFIYKEPPYNSTDGVFGRKKTLGPAVNYANLICAFYHLVVALPSHNVLKHLHLIDVPENRDRTIETVTFTDN
jgi:hypothetical protein